MPTLTIDGMEIEVEPGTSILQACEQLGIEIPRFCFHDRLSVPANCRMCLVEMEKAPKPVASCAMACGDGMVIHTDSEMTQKARRGVMEFLLINHPLDCPICDQGGECDLQDQAMAYGYDRSRYGEPKRAVKEKNLGPLIKTFMTRCIHCTRCVRFADEIAGVPEMGATGRSEHMEIGTYIQHAITSELSGNMIDICPVGALTSKPYAFNARPWELRKTETIDVMDAVGSNIRVDARGGEVLRVLPRLNEAVNEEWISDKTRFACDGLRRQRLDRPYVRRDGKLQAASWEEAFDAIASALEPLSPSQFGAIAGDLCDAESMFALKTLLDTLSVPNRDCRQDGTYTELASRAGYLFNTTIAGIEQADAVLLVGTNPRWEAPLVNARIRKRWLQGGLAVGLVGENVDLTYGREYLGAGPSALAAVVDGSHEFGKILGDAQNPMVVLGPGALARPDGQAVYDLALRLAATTRMIGPDWNGFNVLNTAASRVGALDIGFMPVSGGLDIHGILNGASSGDIKAVWLHGADEIDASRLGDAFVIYQGHHGDRGAHRADVILPGAAFTEKNATYVNLEGRAQTARMAVFPPGEAKEDWKIVRALAGRLDQDLGFNSLRELRQAMIQATPSLGEIDTIAPSELSPVIKAAADRDSGKVGDQPFSSPVTNFYQTDPISRASETMAQCVAQLTAAPAEAAE